MPDKSDLLSISAYAARVDVNKSTISRQVAAGKIPIAGHDKHGRPLIDPRQADAARANNLNPLMARNVPPADERIAALPGAPSVDDGDEPDLLSAGERRSPAGSPTKTGALTAAHAADKSLSVMLKRLALGQQTGELISAADAKAEFQTMSRTFRDRTLGWVIDIAPVILATALKDGTEAAVRSAMQGHARKFLEDLSNEFKRDFRIGADPAASGEMAGGIVGVAGGGDDP